MRIAGYFDSLKNANKAIDELRKAGYEKAFLDLKDETMKDKNTITNLPGTQMNTSLSDLVLESGNRGIDIDKAPLSAADPLVSGIAGFKEITDLSHKIVVEVKKNSADDAKSIIEKMGGSLEKLDYY